MNKIIINPSDGFAYNFINNKLEKVGAYDVIECCNAELNLYKIGSDIYHLNEYGHYLLLATNANIALISTTSSAADCQFALIKDTPLFVSSQNCGISELPDIKGYRKVFFPTDKKTPSFALINSNKDAIIIYEEEKEFENCDENTKEFFNNGKVYAQNHQAIYQKHSDAFFWNGAIYTKKSECYAKTLMEILVCNKYYTVIYGHKTPLPTFLINHLGIVKSIGSMKCVKKTERSTIMVTNQNDCTYLWNMTDKFIEEITHILPDETFDIGENGCITIFSKTDLGFDNGGLVDETIIYKPTKNGSYQKL